MQKLSQDTINIIIKNRTSGMSISQIVKIFSVPKTTVWKYIKDIELSEELHRSLRSQQGGSKKRKEASIQNAKALSKKLLTSEHREMILIFTMLYWAEGNKTDFSFTNTDGNMIRLYITTLTTVLNIPKDDLKPVIRYFTGMDKCRCLNYWSTITGLPTTSFKLYFNDGGNRGKTQYGILRLNVKKSSFYLKLYNSLLQEYLSTYSP